MEAREQAVGQFCFRGKAYLQVRSWSPLSDVRWPLPQVFHQLVWILAHINDTHAQHMVPLSLLLEEMPEEPLRGNV